MASLPDFGALVLSLDFELRWGLGDFQGAGEHYQAHLLGARTAIPRLLDLFAEFEVAATWATVGLLFARSRQELEQCAPAVRPRYADPSLSPYQEPIGAGETDDPLHFAPSLIRTIQGYPRQEIGTHTFSHYYCLEPGQTRAAFAADLRSALAIARTYRLRLRSLVFPRNQVNRDYLPLLADAGIVAYRGNPRAWMYQASAANRSIRRAGRLADTYLPVAGPHLTGWDEVQEPNGLCNVPASFFLRPYTPRLRRLEGLRRQRLVQSIRAAARERKIAHLWWHPHNFGVHTDENLAFLRGLLAVFAAERERRGLRSLSMAEVADCVRAEQWAAVRVG